MLNLVPAIGFCSLPIDNISEVSEMLDNMRQVTLDALHQPKRAYSFVTPNLCCALLEAGLSLV